MMRALKNLRNLLIIFLLAISLVACSSGDVTKELKLRENYENKSFKEDGIGLVDVFKYEDGDTVFFGSEDDYYKVRFLGADTPETVGDLEPFGKKSSNFTEERLKNAEKIVVESTKVGEHAELDSYSRYLGYVWYLPKGQTEFINLNLELVRNGLADLRETPKYSEYFKKAKEQATKEKIGIYSSGDPDFSSDIHDVTIKELSENFDSYLNKRVRFTGYVSESFHEIDDTGDSIFVEELVDGQKYRVKIYKHTVDDDIYYIGNKSTFIGYAVDYHGNKRITGITLRNRDTEFSEVVQKGYFIQFGTKILSNCQYIKDNLYNDLEIQNLQVKDNLLTIVGVANRRGTDVYDIDPLATVTIKVPLKENEKNTFKVGDMVTLKGYSNVAIDYKVNEFSLEVLSIKDIKLA